MADKNDRLEIEAVVVEACGNGMFKVKASDTHNILCTLSGKIKLNNIRILIGDKIRVELCPYDTDKGRIIYRSK